MASGKTNLECVVKLFICHLKQQGLSDSHKAHLMILWFKVEIDVHETKGFLSLNVGVEAGCIIIYEAKFQMMCFTLKSKLQRLTASLSSLSRRFRFCGKINRHDVSWIIQHASQTWWCIIKKSRQSECEVSFRPWTFTQVLWMWNRPSNWLSPHPHLTLQ